MTFMFIISFLCRSMSSICNMTFMFSIRFMFVDLCLVYVTCLQCSV